MFIAKIKKRNGNILCGPHIRLEIKYRNLTPETSKKGKSSFR